MDENVLIQVNHVSMCFHLASERFDGFKEYLIQRMKKKITYQEFWALSDVSFEVERGETLGVFLILVLYVYFFFRFLKRLFSR